MAEALAQNPALLNIIYPKTDSSTFDMEYYLKNHMPCKSIQYSSPPNLSYHQSDDIISLIRQSPSPIPLPSTPYQTHNN